MKNLEFGHYCWSATSAFDFPNPLADAQATKKPLPTKFGAAFYFYKKASDYAVLFLICEMVTIRCIYYYTQAKNKVNRCSDFISLRNRRSPNYCRIRLRLIPPKRDSGSFLNEIKSSLKRKYEPCHPGLDPGSRKK